MKENKKGNNILSLPTNLLGIFAHEDDEILSAGGTLIKNSRLGGNSYVVCFSGSKNERANEYKNACRIMGIDYELLGMKEGHYDKNKLETINSLRNRIIQFKPEFIITHRKDGDYHLDHQVVSEIARDATIRAQTPLEGWVSKGLLYTETHSLHSIWHVNVDISEDYNKVIEALNCHRSQIKKLDGYYLDLLKAKTNLRGIQAGCERAEAFFYEPLSLIGAFHRRNFGV